ncbi:MAG: methyltransferase domain-containing protein [Bacteroidetes bacterium]|nr:methyltransferase domain-containing protein [Bacteroidota bacterium]
MIATDHRLSELITMYHELADMYNAGANKQAARISDHVTRQNLLKSLSSLNIRKVLDAGGGTGNWAVFLAEQGMEVTLMDASPDMLKIAEQKIHEKELPVKIIKGNIEETPFEDKEFDLVFAEGGVISLTPDPENMLKEFKRIIKPGGYIWIDYLNLNGYALLQPDMENRSKLIAQEEEMIYMGKHEMPFRLFSPKRIRYMLYDAGFLELNEFGNGIITNPLNEDHEFSITDLDHILDTELTMSRNYIMTGSAFHIEVLAQKIIH